MKIALIGAGGISSAHAPGLNQLGEVAVYSLVGAERLATIWGWPIYDSLPAILDWCDVVDICTPTYTHFDIASAALRAGKDVIVEKPACRTSAHACQLNELAQQTQRHILPAHVVRYFPAYRALKDACSAQVLGDLAVLRFTRRGTFPRWADWFADQEKSGGLVMDLMIHDLDQARWLAGPVESIYANLTEAEGQTAVAHCMLRHRSKAISYVEGIWGPQGTSFETSFHVSGTAGYLAYCSRDDYVVQSNHAPGAISTQHPTAAGEDPYSSELKDFFCYFTQGTEPAVTMADGIEAVRLAEAAIESIQTGTPIIVKEDAHV